MRHLIVTICLTIAVLIGSAGMSWSADFQKGLTAAVKGDYANALREWTPLAKQENAKAQGNLGTMYAFGKEVLKDYVYAHMWWNIAASFGQKNAARNRDFVAGRMTPVQIAGARTLTRECVRKNYKGC